MSRDSVDAKVRSGKLHKVLRGVYTVLNGKLPRRAEFWAAVLAAGNGAVLSHESAAEIFGLLTEPAPGIHITVPSQRSIGPIPGVIIHRSSRVAGLRFASSQLPVTWITDTLLDLVSATRDFDVVCGWITSAFAERKVTEFALRISMDSRKRLRWRADLDALITEAANGTHSPLEYRYDRDVERAHGLPGSVRQSPYTKPDGSRGYRDRYYERYRVIVELDGTIAHPGRSRWNDIRRDNSAAADHDSQSLRYGWRDVSGDPCGTAMQVGKVLRNRGWTGDPHPCDPACPIGSNNMLC